MQMLLLIQFLTVDGSRLLGNCLLFLNKLKEMYDREQNNCNFLLDKIKAMF